MIETAIRPEPGVALVPGHGAASSLESTVSAQCFATQPEADRGYEYLEKFGAWHRLAIPRFMRKENSHG